MFESLHPSQMNADGLINANILRTYQLTTNERVSTSETYRMFLIVQMTSYMSKDQGNFDFSVHDHFNMINNFFLNDYKFINNMINNKIIIICKFILFKS